MRTMTDKEGRTFNIDLVDNARVFDDIITPLAAALGELCEKNDVPFVLAMQRSGGSVETTECFTSSYVNGPASPGFRDFVELAHPGAAHICANEKGEIVEPPPPPTDRFQELIASLFKAQG